MKTLTALLLAILLSACGSSAPTFPEPENQLIEFRGTNYALFDYGPEVIPSARPPPGWYYPGQNMKLVVGLLHLDPDRVVNQLETMSKSGMNTLVVTLWVWNIDHDVPGHQDFDGHADGVFGELLDSSLGKMYPQHAQNLNFLIRKSAALGFEKFIIRFNYNNDIVNNYTEANYQNAIAYQDDVRTVARAAWQEASGKLPTDEILFDLGGEILHNTVVAKPQALSYLQRRWKEWTVRYNGTLETVGYSAIHARGLFIGLADQVYKTSGVYPKYAAITTYPRKGDQYDDMYLALTDLRRQLQGRDMKIVVLETFWNDTESIGYLQKFIQEYPESTPAIFANWQMTRDSTREHFTQSVYGDLDCVSQNFMINRVLPIVCPPLPVSSTKPKE